MLNRPVVLIIGGAVGLLFLIISVFNTRSLNSSLMSKLEETEVLILTLLSMVIDQLIDICRER